MSFPATIETIYINKELNKLYKSVVKCKGLPKKYFHFRILIFKNYFNRVAIYL